MLRTWALDQPNPTTISEYLDQIHPLGFCPEGDVIADVCAFYFQKRPDLLQVVFCLSVVELN